MDCLKIRDLLEEYVLNQLYETRRKHTLGVRDTALMLCDKYGADPLKAEIAALAHDMYRGLRGKELNDTVRALGLPDIYIDNPNLAHSKIAAIKLAEDYGVEDRDILNAVSYHTTGRAGMSILEKIIFLADAIEPGRSYPGVESIRDKEKEGLDAGCLASMLGTIEHLSKEGVFIDSDTREAAEYLKEKR